MAYRCFCSTRRLNWLRNDAMRRKEVPRYDNRCRHLSQANIEEFEARKTESCIRFKVNLLVVETLKIFLVFSVLLHDKKINW